MQQTMIPLPRPGVNSGPDRCASTPWRKPIPEKLEGPDRRAWEKSILETPGLKGSRLHLARVLLDEFAWGKCWCYPGDELLARKCGLGIATIGRCLRDLAGLDVVRIIRDRGRRRIVFPSHPNARAYLDAIGVPVEVPGPIRPDPTPADHPVGSADHSDGIPHQVDRGVDHFDGRSVLVKPGDGTRIEAAPEMSPSGSNENEKTPEPPVDWKNWRQYMPDLGGSVPAVPAEKPKPTARPAIDPAERDAIIGAALGVQQTGQDPARATDGPGVDESPIPPAGPSQWAPGNIPVDAEAETIKALSKLGPGSKPGEILVATARLTALFGDPKSRAFYRSVCSDVARGQLPARVLVAAVGSARGPGVRNPGAAFTAHIRRCKAAAESRRGTGGS